MLKIKDLTTGNDLDFEVKGASSFAWANDNKTIFYSVIDPVTLRSYRVYRQTLGAGKPELVFEEKDSKFSIGVSASKTREWIIVSSGSATTSEDRILPADNPMGEFNIFLPRVKDVEYDVYPHRSISLSAIKTRKI